MIFTLLALVLFQIEPRFTMTVAPGDMVRAELFEMDGGLTDQGRRQLLGDAVLVTEASEDFPGWGSLRVISARGSDGTLIAVVDAPGHEGVGNKVCRASTNPHGTVDNRTRAANWCLSFFDPTMLRMPVIIPPPPVPPRAPTGT